MFVVRNRQVQRDDAATGLAPGPLASFHPMLAQRVRAQGTKAPASLGCTTCGGGMRSGFDQISDPPRLPDVFYGPDHPLCDGAWGSLALQMLAILEANSYCEDLYYCPTGTGYLCEGSSWDPENCRLEYDCCACRTGELPHPPTVPFYRQPGGAQPA